MQPIKFSVCSYRSMCIYYVEYGMCGKIMVFISDFVMVPRESVVTIDDSRGGARCSDGLCAAPC